MFYHYFLLYYQYIEYVLLFLKNIPIFYMFTQFLTFPIILSSRD